MCVSKGRALCRRAALVSIVVIVRESRERRSVSVVISSEVTSLR